MICHVEGISWPSDRQRYKNPADYRHRNRTSWLYDRFPAVSDLEEDLCDALILVNDTL